HAAVVLLLVCGPAAHRADAANALPGLIPADLRCEHAVDPLGVDVPRPRLSWVVQSDRRNQRQSAYRILAASTEAALARDEGNLWDSGRVESADTLHIPYAGAPLRTSQQVFWKVRSWDADGVEGPWSEPAVWTMGVAEPASWQAKWIRAPWDAESLLARRQFDVRPDVTRVVAHVSGLGQFELWLNGRKVGENLVSPGWTKYDKSVLYETHDLTALVRRGANAVGVLVGDGMYHSERSERYSKFTGSYGPQRTIVQIELEYGDGSREQVATDGSWQVRRGPLTFTDVYGGEDFDARLAPAGWADVGAAAEGWEAAVEMDSPEGVLRGFAASAPPLRAIETITPRDARALSPSRDVIDLGQNASFMPRIRVAGPAGSTIRLTHAEVTHPDGTINRASCGGAKSLAYWQYTKATDDEETWFPQFFYAGCRYLQVDRLAATPGAPLPRLEGVEGVVVHSSAAPVGEFECSDPLINRIRTLVRWAQRSNMASVLTDCPHREKLGWVEQYHLNGPAIRYEFDVTRILVKGMYDMHDSQTAEGLVPNIAPELTEFGGGFRASTEWGAAFILVPWQHYEFTGDVGLCRQFYPAMQRYMDYLASSSEGHIVKEGLGDWYDLGPNPPGFAQQTPPPITGTAFYYQDAALMAKIARALGRAEDAERYAQLAAEIRAAWLKKFRHPESGRYATNSQCTNALALVMGLAEPEDRDQALAELIADIRRNENGVTTGDVGFRYLLMALSQAGRSDVIYDIARQQQRPGYAYQLRQGATSLTEAWDANHDASQNHFMLGQIVEWLYQDLLGISTDPEAPGFERIRIAPAPVGDLAWARGGYRSVRGPIRCAWRREGERFALEVAIPANTTATVALPSRSAAGVTEGGKPIAEAEGVQFLRQEGDRSIYRIGSGSYSFASTISSPTP
ncbi:MAG TPA: family 78 glycoside hydrolase catalytic domain, partial [Lacipirellulaceae bacterium]|nr:family 78 glycoside hydrolase catalytic domain [Lacipirellulaceae bacterium]